MFLLVFIIFRSSVGRISQQRRTMGQVMKIHFCVNYFSVATLQTSSLVLHVMCATELGEYNGPKQAKFKSIHTLDFQIIDLQLNCQLSVGHLALNMLLFNKIQFRYLIVISYPEREGKIGCFYYIIPQSFTVTFIYS